MQKLNRLFHALLLLTTPSMLLYPSVQIRADDYSHMQFYYQEEYIWDRFNRGELVTFDEMMEFLEKFENGDYDDLPDEECEKIIHLIILLSRNGIHPNDIEGRAALEADIEELLRDDDDDDDYYYEYEYELSFQNRSKKSM